jgi:hypothetical protein
MNTGNETTNSSMADIQAQTSEHNYNQEADLAPKSNGNDFSIGAYQG